ncbi:Histone deacetylase domain [Phytophthora cactorum]|nr:Histone deacetylase domain [Phytophthora cactorum]
MHYGKSAQLNFPHLHDSFIRPEVAFSVRPQNPSAAAPASATPPAAHSASAGYILIFRTRARQRSWTWPRPRTWQTLTGFARCAWNCSTHRGQASQDGERTRVYAHAQIHVNGKVVNLGTFSTAKDAAMAYDKAALRYFGGPIGSSDAHPEEIAGGSSYASRSAQNAKYNLSIMKLNAWMSKLQRSVKMVEASQRVEWGLHPESMKTEEEQEGTQEKEEATSALPLLKIEIFGSGPTIKREFTTRDQKLRQSKKEIQEAIALMIEELKIYAADAPVDPLFQPPPRCAPILDLLSTSRHLKLISAINDLAHLKVKMSSSNEKQKLASYMRDLETAASPSPTTVSGSANNYATTTEGKIQASKRPDILKNAKYVKRKVPISIPQKSVVIDLLSDGDSSEQVDEEIKKEVAATAAEASSADVNMVVVALEEQKQPEGSTDETVAMEKGTAAPQDASSDKESVEKETKVAADSSEMREEESKEDSPEASNTEVKAVAENSEDKAEDAVTERAEEARPDDDNAEDAIPASSKSTTSNVENEPDVAEKDGDISMEEADQSSSSTTVVVPKDEFEWQFCLAIQVPTAKASPRTTEDVWRLLPLSSKTQMGEFIEDVFLTKQEVLEMEVSEEDVCSSSAAPDGKSAWMEHLRQLHAEESQVRQQIQRETNHQHALQGIMKIEQGRLSEISVVYREAMNKLNAKTALALKNHARVSQDAQLVKLMQHSFNPILGDLLDKCEEALLNCFRKLSLRFVDFSQEFEYYRSALLSLTQSSGKEITTEEGRASPVDASDLDMDDDSVTIKRENIAKVTEEVSDTTPTIASGDVVELVDDTEAVTAEKSDEFDDLGDSSGLREAYINFYMGEMEALWKERSSSLEMVQAIQRSLLHTSLQVDASSAKPVEVQKPSEAKSSEVAEMKVEENEDAEKTVESTETEAQFEEKAAESEANLEVSQEETTSTGGATTEKEADVIVEKADEEEEAAGKFRREQELREAVESCLTQWQRIQWPEELNSTFLTPTTTSISANDVDVEYESPYSVMDELKRVMIDLTQDQVIPVPPPVEPTTLVMYHPVFINHQTPKDHPECPERMDRVVNILNTLVKKHQETLKLERLAMSPEELCPPETTLLMVHSPTYLRQLKERSIEAGSQSSSSPTASSPSSRALVFESDSGIRDETPKRGGRKKYGRPPLVGAFGAASLEQNGVELDTFVSSKSWDVARAAAGTVCLAVDRVVRKEYHNAVCLVRPPGHHVGRHGRTQNAPSSGFCLLNNVVIGATHARLYPWIRKVAVLDWDIHHGNGTEELLMDDPDAFFASIHLYSSGKYFPGTGKSCETGNRVNVALENTGAGSGSQAFRSALELKVLPAMRAFQPDIIFISAGFDGHRDDIIGGVAAVNNPNVPAGYVEEDYAWATLEVLKLAAEVCDGRVVSVLEGGYDVRRETNSLAKSVAAHVAAISAYEAARRMSDDSGTADVEMKEEEGADTTGPAATSAHGGTVIKTEHPIKMESVGLLEKLLSTDLDDGNVTIIDDEDNDEEAGETRWKENPRVRNRMITARRASRTPWTWTIVEVVVSSILSIVFVLIGHKSIFCTNLSNQILDLVSTKTTAAFANPTLKATAMSDPFYLADILLGRVGVLRSTAESIILELCEAQAKLEPGQASDDALRLAIKNKLERVQTNLKLLRKLVPEFDGKTKPIESVNQTHRNVMLEYHWKSQVQDMGAKAQAVYLEQLSGAFPRLEMLGDVRCPPTPSSLFVPKSHKRGRVFDPYGEKQPATLNEMMDYMMAKNRKLKFFKHAETTRGGRRVIKSIKCEINKEVTVHLSFCPPIPESGPNGESGVAASPMTPSTPTSPAFASGRLRSTRNKHKKQQQQLVKKKKGDMLTKARLAAEEATKMEIEELKQRITEAREAIKEQEQARAAGLQVTKYIQRLSIFPYNEDAPLGAWSESSHNLFRLVTLHGRKALDHFRKQHPETCFYHLFAWLGYYDKIYQTPCSFCKKLLAKESEEWAYVPPSFRDYANGQAFHSKCLPIE